MTSVENGATPSVDAAFSRRGEPASLRRRGVVPPEAHWPNACGPRCLDALLTHIGRAVPWIDLLALTGWCARGTSFAGLANAAQHLGLGARAFHMTVDALKAQLAAPGVVGAVLQVRPEHFVALLAPMTDGFEIDDPRRMPTRRSTWSALALQERWTGNALVLHGEICQ